MNEQKKYSLTPKNAKIFQNVIDLIGQGNSVRKIFRDHKDIGTTRDKFNEWLRESKELVNQYARATSQRADIMFDEIVEIADKQGKDVKLVDGIEVIDHNLVNRNRLQIDSRKWILSKMNPKKYGDKLDIDQSLDNQITITVKREKKPPIDER